MTNLEAVKAYIEYPLSDNSYKLALLNRSLEYSDVYDKTKQKDMELSGADALKSVITSADIKDNTYSVTAHDVVEIKKLIASIYTKWGYPDPLAPKLSNATNMW
jgi:hypothetical protein